ncbi:MAG: argininosuccinate lyase [Firmicutes bacterium]|nr:argininosuccinate lyase [Bacillota bacterium]
MSQMARSNRFAGGLSPEAAAFCSSLSFDWRLLPDDIEGSLAHLAMLEKAHILPEGVAVKLRQGLIQIREEWSAGNLVPRPEWEDVHMNVEGRLHEIVGPDAGYLHTGRSRNDQVATDMHLYLKRQALYIGGELAGLIATLQHLAEETLDVVMPGHTHMQPAQPILMAHHWLAYAWMFQRDATRLDDWTRRADLSPLGAGALAGTPYSSDPDFTRRQLGFAGLYQNSLDAVSDRDYLIEFLSWASLFMMHVSRLAEELVLWSSPAFGYVTPGDGYSTGSSIMPQKKNPDVAELMRGKSGRVFGHLMSLLAVMKGLPLAYNSDMQEDKESVFDTIDTVLAVLSVLPGLLRSLEIHADRMRDQAEAQFVNATDLADLLTEQGTPFREAHHRVGQLVKDVLNAGYDRFSAVPEDAWREFAPDIPQEWAYHLTPETLVAARRQPFSTARASVESQIAQLALWLNQREADS